MAVIYYPEKNGKATEKTYYDANPEQGLHPNMRIYDRLLTELNHKQYYTETEFRVILEENGLDASEFYNKNLHYRKLLCTVLEILEMLANNIDVFRTVETEFATTSEAYKYLERRIQRLQQRIDSIPDEPILGGRDSDFTHIFMD